MSFLDPLDAIPKNPFSFFAEFWVWVTSGAWGSVSVGFWGGRQLSLLGGEGSSHRAVPTSRPQSKARPPRGSVSSGPTMANQSPDLSPQASAEPEGGNAAELLTQLALVTANLEAAEGARTELQKALEEQRDMNELELEAERQRASEALKAKEAELEQLVREQKEVRSPSSIAARPCPARPLGHSPGHMHVRCPGALPCAH